MKNIAVVIAISDYENITPLPGCKNDYRLISDILRATNKYTEILEIYDKTDSSNVKESLMNFFSSVREEEIGELFFYYTGHGTYDGEDEDLKFALTDYSKEKHNTTTLSNNFIDQQIRGVNPKLTVKVIDACNSGIPYIKGDLEFSQIFEQEKAISNLYFMFSSHSHQSSYVDTISHFTKSFAEAILNYKGNEISYTSIIEYIKDKFAQSSKQTPYFVTQGAMSDIFCNVTELIKNIDIKKYEKQILDVQKEEISLTESIKILSKSYLPKDEIDKILNQAKEFLSEIITIDFLAEVFSLDVIEISNYTDILDIKSVAKWIDKNSNNYFIEIEKKEVGNNNIYGNLLQDYFNSRNEPIGISTKLNTVFDSLKIKLKPIYPAIPPYQCNAVFLISRYKFTIFYKFITYHETGWEIYDYGDSSKWKYFDMRYDNKDEGIQKIKQINIEFSEYVKNDILVRLEAQNSKR